MRRRTAGRAWAGFSAVTSLTALAGPLGAQQLQIGAQAPNVTIDDLDGAPYSFAGFLGSKPALIEFWATWCPLCEKLMPQLQEAHRRYGAAVEFIGVNVTVNQSKARVRRYLDEHRPPFRALWDEDGIAVRAYEVTGTSFIVIVDAAGKVAYTGYGEDQDILAALRKVVGR
jgi:thiol-disulfide isomerase/thioredoxin